MGMGDYPTIDKKGNTVWVLTKDTLASAHKHSRKRYRASAIIIRDGKLLLVQHKGERNFSLPGGGFHHKETTIQAGIREATREELGGINVLSANRMKHYDMESAKTKHKFVLLTISGEPYIKQSREINKVIWWDMKSLLPVHGHVKHILGELNGAIK